MHKNNADNKYKKVALVRALYSNMGDYAIFKGTLKVLDMINIKPQYIFDPEPFFTNNYLQKYELEKITTTIGLIEEYFLYKKKLVKSLIVLPLYCIKNFIRMIGKYRKNINFLIILGGSRFGGKFEPHVLIEIINVIYKKKVLGAKTVVVGISVAKPEQNLLNVIYSYFYKYFARNVEHIFVRDNLSYSNLKKIGVHDYKISLVCDFAFWLQRKTTLKTMEIKNIIQASNSKTRTVGIAVRIFDKKNNKKYFDNILKLINKLDKDGYYIYWIPTSFNKRNIVPPHDQDDYLICSDINEKINKNYPIINSTELEPEEYIDVISNLNGIISFGRMHGAIFGVVAGIPTVHVYSHEKSLGLFETFFEYKIPLYSVKEFIDKNNEISESIINYLRQDNNYLNSNEEALKRAREISAKKIAEEFKRINALK